VLLLLLPELLGLLQMLWALDIPWLLASASGSEPSRSVPCLSPSIAPRAGASRPDWRPAGCGGFRSAPATTFLSSVKSKAPAAPGRLRFAGGSEPARMASYQALDLKCSTGLPFGAATCKASKYSRNNSGCLSRTHHCLGPPTTQGAGVGNLKADAAPLPRRWMLLPARPTHSLKEAQATQTSSAARAQGFPDVRSSSTWVLSVSETAARYLSQEVSVAILGMGLPSLLRPSSQSPGLPSAPKRVRKSLRGGEAPHLG
jgi:hypothetical protein